MAIIKCKMCGGDLVLTEGSTVAECEYCGTVQTVPAADNEKKLTLFTRANRLRYGCEFDKAAGVYEAIVAEFPEEPEAYWGLVLCKYGIEYVDDPATGKKIPTCHRSGFDCVTDDNNYEMALEYADVVARKVYREEAKTIEQIRKGIIEVSAKEEPYDIFICYKETEIGSSDRTLDSVLAQDVYDALTEKGYRVFFSRVTLEDKLGVEYEPYIFAALNSAKIMLAFGTDYEHYNAVWVKNEWSRYLKLMAEDRSKHLIPCYKNIDIEDMPKEFRKLQAQDLGKVGATQDLLRGIEKILPKATSVTVVQEHVVVGSSGGDNKIAALLDRGNMALEDGDWTKADGFFEEVLNNDAKNALAYLGKTLAQEKCRTIDAFVRKRKERYQNANGETLKLQAVQTHIEEMADRFMVPGYVAYDEIRKLYDYDLSYHSDLAQRRKQYRQEQAYWDDHKLLSRAEQFAIGAVAESLQREKNALFAALNDHIKKAEVDEAAEKTKVRTAYEAHIAEADKKAEQMYQDGLKRREDYYQGLCLIAKNETDVTILTNSAIALRNLGDYKDSKNLAEHCDKRAAEEQAKLDAEQKRRDELARKEAEIRAKRYKKKAIIVTSILSLAVALVVALGVVLATVIIPTVKYNEAVAFMEAGNVVDAYEAFTALNGYKDSEAKAKTIYEQYKSELFNRAEKGSRVFFGSYEQDNDTSNGKENIEWLVLKVENGKALVISKYALDGRNYHEASRSVTWETCSLRQWLNDDFWRVAFSDEEKTKILTAEVSPDENPEYNTNAGNPTNDKVFLLSSIELEMYFSSNRDMRCKPTEYAVAQGVHTMDDGFCSWWMRSPGSYQDTAEIVDHEGDFGGGGLSVKWGDGVNYYYPAVRPVLWIDINS